MHFKDGDRGQEGRPALRDRPPPLQGRARRGPRRPSSRAEAHLKRLEADYRRAHEPATAAGRIGREEYDRIVGDHAEAEAAVGVAKAEPRPGQAEPRVHQGQGPDQRPAQPPAGRPGQPGPGRRRRPDDDRLARPALRLLRRRRADPAAAPPAGPRGEDQVAHGGGDPGLRRAGRRGRTSRTRATINFSDNRSTPAPARSGSAASSPTPSRAGSSRPACSCSPPAGRRRPTRRSSSPSRRSGPTRGRSSSTSSTTRTRSVEPPRSRSATLDTRACASIEDGTRRRASGSSSAACSAIRPGLKVEPEARGRRRRTPTAARRRSDATAAESRRRLTDPRRGRGRPAPRRRRLDASDRQAPRERLECRGPPGRRGLAPPTPARRGTRARRAPTGPLDAPGRIGLDLALLHRPADLRSVLSIVITLAGGDRAVHAAARAVPADLAADGAGRLQLSRRQRPGRRRGRGRADRAAGQRRREHAVHVVAVHQRRLATT